MLFRSLLCVGLCWSNDAAQAQAGAKLLFKVVCRCLDQKLSQDYDLAFLEQWSTILSLEKQGKGKGLAYLETLPVERQNRLIIDWPYIETLRQTFEDKILQSDCYTNAERRRMARQILRSKSPVTDIAATFISGMSKKGSERCRAVMHIIAYPIPGYLPAMIRKLRRED